MMTRYKDIPSYVTKDGSEIRELLHPMHHGNMGVSVAEAVVHAGCSTAPHRHIVTEEVYHVTSGRAIMTLGSERLFIEAGDTIYISPGTIHNLENTQDTPLKILCLCHPPYGHDDTELV
ncbi:MAG: cupin domain-containing protein [Nitrospirae bacterium]|nr:cupin domain-containing protein [Nitrospirota bacterium]